jgi:hypothetical protein
MHRGNICTVFKEKIFGLYYVISANQEGDFKQKGQIQQT